MLKNIKKPMFLVCINNVETVDVFVDIITLKSDVYVQEDNYGERNTSYCPYTKT